MWSLYRINSWVSVSTELVLDSVLTIHVPINIFVLQCLFRYRGSLHYRRLPLNIPNSYFFKVWGCYPLQPNAYPFAVRGTSEVSVSETYTDFACCLRRKCSSRELILKHFQSRGLVHLWSWHTKYHIISHCSRCRELLFQAYSQRHKRLFQASSCGSFRLSHCLSICSRLSLQLLPDRRISAKCDVGEIPNQVKIGQNYRAFYMKTWVHFIYVGYIRTRRWLDLNAVKSLS